MAISAPLVSPEQAQHFRDDGFFVLGGVVPPVDLETLRNECQRFIDEREAERDRLGADTIDLDHRGQRYFAHAWGKSPPVERFLRSDLVLQIAQAALGDTVYLFNEQYLLKAAERGMKFGWHQESGFIPYAHRPYLTCWIALDDVSEANGTVYLLPTPAPERATSSSTCARRRRTTSSATSGTTRAIRFSSPPGVSPASRGQSSTAAARTRPTACAVSTSRSTRAGRS
jgi:hypothetical protein